MGLWHCLTCSRRALALEVVSFFLALRAKEYAKNEKCGDKEMNSIELGQWRSSRRVRPSNSTRTRFRLQFYSKKYEFRPSLTRGKNTRLTPNFSNISSWTSTPKFSIFTLSHHQWFLIYFYFYWSWFLWGLRSAHRLPCAFRPCCPLDPVPGDSMPPPAHTVLQHACPRARACSTALR